MRKRGSKISAEIYKDVIISRYLNDEKAESIASRWGISASTCYVICFLYEAMKSEDWEKLITKITTDKSVTRHSVRLAADFANRDIPENITAAFDEREARLAAAAEEKSSTAAPAPAVPTTPPTTPPAAPAHMEVSNESVFFIRILEELHATNELLRDLIDATIPKYAEDIRKDMRIYFDGAQKYQRDLETQLVGDLRSAIDQTMNSNCDAIMQLMNRQTDALNGIKCNMRKNNRQEDKS